MMEALMSGGLVSQILLIVLVLNIVLTAAKQILELLAQKLQKPEMGSVAAALAKVLSVLAGLTDWISANKEHK